jgi:predicted DNA binding CopG/RHH family protein
MMINGKEILVQIIKLTKALSDGQKTGDLSTSVNLRFCVAILQKMSIKSQLIPIFIELDIIEFIIRRLELHYSSNSPPPGSRVFTGEQHIFFLDFSTALLANILHSKVTLEWLKNNRHLCISLTNRLIEAINQKKVPPSVIMHLLISLSYIIKSPMLKSYAEGPDCNFSERISQFVEYFSKKPINSNQAELVDDENGDIDKRTILDLCAHMFHPPKNGGDDEFEDSAEQFIMSYEVGEFNDMRTDDRIKEFENEQGDLIFECFQDEEVMFT